MEDKFIWNNLGDLYTLFENLNVGAIQDQQAKMNDTPLNVVSIPEVLR